MWMLVKVGVRNGLRNKRRTFLAGAAIGIGLGALIFVDAIMLGMSDSLVRSATDTFLGQAQVHAKGFTDTLAVERTVADGGAILAGLRADPEVKSYAPRVMAMGMVSSPANACSVLLYGISPAREKGVSQLARVVVEGDYLPDNDTQKILIGRDLADTLSAEVGSLVVVTVAQAGTGDLSQAMFRVGGIFKFNVREMDGGMAFIPLPKAQDMLDLAAGFHEIAVNFQDLALADDKTRPFWSLAARGDNAAQNWRELMPELDAALDLTDFALGLMALILLGVVSLGIVNTLFMSLYERMFEFGVLRAVGTRPVRMALMILAEAGLLAGVSIAIGIVLGLAVTLIFQWHGLDYSGIDYAGVTFQEPLTPIFRLYQYYVYPALLFAFTLVVGLYPAIYAARLNPTKAMRKSL